MSARELYAFYKLGGYIGLTGVTLVNKDGSGCRRVPQREGVYH